MDVSPLFTTNSMPNFPCSTAVWSKLVRFLSKIYPLEHLYSSLDSSGWLEITTPCIHEMN
jgi:hypothetical protein